MCTDYEEIARDSRRRYGEDVGRYGEVLLAGLYNDRKHFIFELLQNAEDAGATNVEFRLDHTSLEFRHNGRPFNSEDVRGICGILASSSQNDRSRIGRFGIGFKSVYAYTTLPEIHSGHEHFAIRDFVIPFAIPERPIVKATTRFIFPFNRDSVPAHTAYEEIMDGLYDLGPKVLLFLKNLQRIRYEVSNGGSGVYRREEQADRELRIVHLHTDREVNAQEERWVIFKRPVSAGDKAGNVAIAFRLATDATTNAPRIEPVAQSRLVVYFPTTKETHLGFLIHGPFHTTPTREDIRDDDPVNRALMTAIAQLVPQALAILRDHGLLTISCLQSLPLRPDAYPPTSAFRPVYDAVRRAFKEVPFLPTSDGTHASAGTAALTRSSGLRNLLSASQLQMLQSATDAKHWLHGDITETRTPDLWRYLRNQLGIPEIDPESFARLVNEAFLQAQPSAWVARFYAFLLEHPALWQNLPASSGRRGTLLDKPIIRLADGTHVRPFRENGQPSAYVGGTGGSDLPTVAPEVHQDQDARAFLRRLGLPEPDKVAAIIEQVLALYQTGAERQPTLSEHIDHVRVIFRMLSNSADTGRQQTLKAALRRTPFIYGKNAANPNRFGYKLPSQVYFSTADLRLYFDGYEGAWFAVDTYEPYREALKDLGVTDAVRVSRPRQITHGNVIIREEHSNYERGTRGFNPECNIPGLTNALTNPNRLRSAFIWNSLLIPNAGNIIGTVERATQQSYANAQSIEMESIMGMIVRSHAWLPDRDGNFHRPSEMSLDDLPPDFSRNELLASNLGMQASSIRTLARELGISADVLEYARRNQDQIRDLMSHRPTRQTASDSDEDAGDLDFDFATELVQRFERVGETTITLEHHPPGPVANPDQRLQRATNEVRTAQTNARPNRQRFKHVPRRIWDARDSRVRETIYQYYGGRCQLCDQEPFAKVDGQPYFEGVHLVSRTRGEWVEHPGNVLCLCPLCSAKFQHGSVEAPDMLGQIGTQRLSNEGGSGQLELRMSLCGEDIRLRYAEQHFIDLKALLSQTAGPSAT